jgi:hypothetical protein
VSPLGSLEPQASADSDSDWTGQPRPPQAAVAVRHLGQVLLVVVLGEIERRCIDDLCRDRSVAVGRQHLLVGSLRGLGGLALRVGADIDAGTVLAADVVALAHALRGVVALPEGLEQRLVADLRRVEYDQHHLVVAGAARAYLLVGRVWRDARGIAHRRHPDPLAHLPELALGTPEAAQAEHRRLQALGVRPLQRPLVEEVGLGRGNGLAASLEGGVRRRHLGLLA